MAHQLEALGADEMRDVALGAGEEIVDADDVVAALQQALAQMRAEEPGPAGHEYPLFEMHLRSVACAAASPRAPSYRILSESD